MNRLTFFLPGRLPDLNEYTYINPKGKNVYAISPGIRLKKLWRERASLIIESQKPEGFEMFDTPVFISLLWHLEENDKRDPDNIVFAKKFIFDGMVDAGVIADDGRPEIAGFIDRWIDADRPGVEVSVTDLT